MNQEELLECYGGCSTASYAMKELLAMTNRISTSAREPIRKICVICNVEVSRIKRTKDALGNYYCGPCWSRKLKRQHRPETATVVAGPTPESDRLFCERCNGRFKVEHLIERNGQVLCLTCTDAESLQPRPKSTPSVFDRWQWASYTAAVIGSILLGIGGFYDEVWSQVMVASRSPVVGWLVYIIAVSAGAGLLIFSRIWGARARTVKPWNAVRRVALIMASLWTVIGIYIAGTQGVWSKHAIYPARLWEKPVEYTTVNELLVFLAAPLAAMWIVSLIRAPES